MHEPHGSGHKDLMEMIQRAYPHGATAAILRSYIGSIARAALDELESEGPCPGGMTLCADGVTCVHDPLDCR